MNVVKGWIKASWADRMLVDVALNSIRTTLDVYWSPPWDAPHGGHGGCNSYVMAESDMGEYAINNKKCSLYSINGMGEVRWSVSKSMIESALDSYNKIIAQGHIPEPWDGDFFEYLLAARHFKLV